MKRTIGIATTLLITATTCLTLNGQGSTPLIETAVANARAMAILQPAREEVIPQVSWEAASPPGTYWFARREVPPLPFNPFLNLRAYEIDPVLHFYLIDDTCVDYEALELDRQEAEAASLLTGSGSGGKGGPPRDGPEPADYGDNLYVHTLTYSNGFLTFDVRNLVPGDDFLVTRMKVLDDNFTNYWVPEWIFTASATNQSITIPLPTDSETGFYRIVNYTLYQGPSLTIASPADDSTVSGVIQVRCTLADIFPPQWAELYVDGNFYSKAVAGPLAFEVDTAKLPNGLHIMAVVLTSYIPLDSNSGYYAHAAATLYSVTTSNWFAADNPPQAFTASLGSVPYQFETTTPAVCQLVVKDSAGATIRTMRFTNETAGPFSAAWDLMKDDSTPAEVPGSYTVTAIAWPFPEPLTNGVPIIFPTSIHHSLHAGYTATFRARLHWSFQGLDSNQQSILQDITDALYWSTRVYYMDPDGYVRTVHPDCPFVFEQNSDLDNFFIITTNLNTGHVVWVGHSTTLSFGNGDDTYITEGFDENEIAFAYGNRLDLARGAFAFGLDGKKGRTRYAEINGCFSGAGDLCWAFGTPKADLDSVSGMEKSSFCGWSSLMPTTGIWLLPDTPYEKHARGLQALWSSMGIDKPGIKAASDQTFQYYGYTDWIPQFVIHGSRMLTWRND